MSLIAPLGVSIPSTIEDLTALFAAGLVKWNGSAFVRADAVENALHLPFAGATPVYVATPLPLGDTTLYTVPAGFALTVTFIQVNNPTNGSVNFTGAYVRRGGVDYQFHQALTQAPRTVNAGSAGLCTNAGDAIKAIAVAAGLVFSFRGYLVPNTHALKPVFALLASGLTTVYTCPVGKVAYLNPVTLSVASSPSFWNATGTTRIYEVYSVPSGGSPDSTNLIAAKSQTNLTVAQGTAVYPTLAAGGTLVINSDGAGTQHCWFTMVEADV